MSRAEGQPIERAPKVRKIARYMLSAAIAVFGINLALHSTEGNAEFYQQNPQVRWAQDIESDFRVDINRALLENDSQGLKDLRDRLPIVSSALKTLDELEDQVPHPDAFGEFAVGMSLMSLGLMLGLTTKISSDRKK